MRRVRMVSIILLLLGVLGLAGVPTGEASDYLGQFCWQATSPGGSAVVKAAVTHMGDGHFLLNGNVAGSSAGLEPFVGSAEVSGSSVYMTTASAGSDSSGTWTSIGRFVLNLGTLSGSGELLGGSHSASGPPQNASLDYDGPVTLTFISCP